MDEQNLEQRLEQAVSRALNNGHYCRSADTLQRHQRMLEKNTDVLGDIVDKVNEINNKVDITKERFEYFQDNIDEKLSEFKDELKDKSNDIDDNEEDIHSLMTFKNTTEVTLVQLVTALNEIQKILTPENSEFIKNIKSNYGKLTNYRAYLVAVFTGLGLLFTILSNFNNIVNLINGWKTLTSPSPQTSQPPPSTTEEKKK